MVQQVFCLKKQYILVGLLVILTGSCSQPQGLPASPTPTPRPTGTSLPTQTPTLPPTLTPTPTVIPDDACIDKIASYSGVDGKALQEFIIQDIFRTFPEFEQFDRPAEFFSEYFSAFHPAWSPDEQKIAFSAGIAAGEAFINFGIFILIDGSSEIKRLVPDRAAVEVFLRSYAKKYAWTEEEIDEILQIMGIAPWAIHPVWSPDGNKIAFLFGFGDNRGEIWVINADGSGLVSLGSGEVEANGSWSPDSQQIIFTTRTYNKTNEIVRVNSNGSEFTILTKEDAYYESPSWSPDGKQIVFVAKPEQTSGLREFANIYVMNTDGSGLINLTSGLEIGAINPTWTPDNQQIIFNSVEYDFYAVKPDGTDLKTTTRDQVVAGPKWFQCPSP